MSGSESPLAAMAALAGGAMSGVSLIETAAQLDACSLDIGCKALATFAQACRELQEYIDHEIGGK